MDPDANLAEIRRIVQDVDLDVFPDRAERLAELISALDQWISKGGFLPAAWRKERKGRS